MNKKCQSNERNNPEKAANKIMAEEQSKFKQLKQMQAIEEDPLENENLGETAQNTLRKDDPKPTVGGFTLPVDDDEQ